MKISAALPTGVAALLFEAAAARRGLEGCLVEELAAAGFGEVILPIVDYLEPYEALLSPASRRELYRFTDRDGESLLVRADFTPMLARLLAPRVAGLPLPLRLFYRGDVVRYAPARAGRQRELYQLGAELLGEPGEDAEATMLRLFLRLLVASGAARPTVVLSFSGALDELLATVVGGGGEGAVAPGQLVAAVARRDRGLIETVASRGRGPQATALAEILELGVPSNPLVLGALAAARLMALERLRAALVRELPAVRVSIDLAELVRETTSPRWLNGQAGEGDGRRYYDGLVFRGWVGGGGEPAGGGGRYDGLFRALGAELPAVGFSLSLDHLLAADARSGRSGGAW